MNDTVIAMIKFRKEERLKYKILFGYLLIIGFVFLLVFFLACFFWKNYVQENIFRTMQNNNYQIKNGIDYYFDDIIGLSEYPFMDEEITEILRKNYSNMESGTQKISLINDRDIINKKLYKNILYMDKNIDSVWLFMENADCFGVKTKGTLNNNYNIKDEKWFEEVLEGNGKPYIIGTHDDAGNIFNQKVVSVARSIIDPVDGKYLGMIEINTRIEQFSNIWHSPDYSGSIVAVSDKNNHLIFPDLGETDTAYFEEFLTKYGQQYEPDKFFKVTINNDSFYLSTTQLPCLEGYIYQLVPVSYATGDIDNVFLGVLFGIIVLGVILLLLSVLISNSITKPVSKLVDIMKAVGDGNLQIQTEEFSGELEVLSRTFNSMIKKMDDMFSKIQEKEREKRDMEMLALQSQINPHFMYNTLNSIRWLSEIQGADNITQILDALIKVLKYMATDMGEYVKVQKEVEFIQNYIKILNFRYFERFSFVFNVDENTLQYLTLRFVLQPIIENAVLHGFDSTDLQATIEIKIYMEEDHLIFSVEDNGKGLSEEKCNEILTKENPKGKSLNKIGIYNVNKRIQLIFGEEYSIKIFSREGCYTRVVVRIPAIMEKDNDE